MAKRFTLGVLSASVIAFLAACGGGGSDTAPLSDTRAPAVTALTAQVKDTTIKIDILKPGTIDIPKNAYLVAEIDEVTQGCPTINPIVKVFDKVEASFTCIKNATGGSVWTIVPTASFADGAKITLTLTPTDASGNQGILSTSFTVIVPPPASATVAITATPTTLVAGQSATLAWTTSNAVSCLGADGLSGSLDPAGGSISVTPTATTTYSIQCWNSANVATSVVSTTVTVTPAAKLEYSNVVIATRPSVLDNLYGVDRTVPGAFLPIKNKTGHHFYSMGIRMPRADNCLVEVSALDNDTFVELKMLFNPKTLEMTMDTTGNQDLLVRFRNDDFKQGDYVQFNPAPADPAFALWETMAQVPAGWYYTLKMEPSINLWFVDNAGVVTQLTDTTFEASGGIRALWSLSCKAP